MFSLYLSVIFKYFGFNQNNKHFSNTGLLFYGLRVKSVLIIIYFVYISVKQLVVDCFQPKQCLFDISFSIKSFVNLLSFLVFVLEFSKISSIEVKVNERLSEAKSESARSVETLSTLIWILLVSTHFAGFSLIFYYFSGDLTSLDAHGWARSLWPVNMFGWSVAVQLYFIMIIYKIHLLEAQLLDTDQARFSRRPMSLKQLRINLFFVIDLKSQVNRHFGPNLFLSFAEIFESTCLRLTYLGLNHSLNPRLVYESLFEYSLLLLINISTIYLVSRFQSKRPDTQKLFASVDQSMSDQFVPNGSFLPLSINSLIMSYTNLDYSPANMFDINRKFSLTYSSAMITFTVMLATIIDQIDKYKTC